VASILFQQEGCHLPVYLTFGFNNESLEWGGEDSNDRDFDDEISMRLMRVVTIIILITKMTERIKRCIYIGNFAVIVIQDRDYT
jgi:hypothetical protein